MMANAIFAAGCFWGVEEYFLALQGVKQTKVGYIGGHTEDPTYKAICNGDTGHAEAIVIDFDEKIIDYASLVQSFFACHNPTQLNRQGVDVGSQYRSAIFYLDDAQKTIAEKVKNEMQGEFSKPIATEITKASKFYNAEEYHQKYIRKQRGQA